MKKIKINRKRQLKNEAAYRNRSNNSSIRYSTSPITVKKKFKCSTNTFETFIKQEISPTIIDNTKKGLYRSFGEMEVEQWLVKNKIDFIIEKEFDDLINPLTGQNLRMDFYIYDRNICVEFDGKQHYMVSRKFDKGDKSLLQLRKQRDIVKNDYCHKNGILMVRIKYTQVNIIAHILTEVILNKKTKW